MRDTQRERQRHRQREKQAPCGEPDAGLDPGFPESHSGLKAALNHWATALNIGILSVTESLLFLAFMASVKQIKISS